MLQQAASDLVADMVLQNRKMSMAPVIDNEALPILGLLCRFLFYI